MTPLKQTIDDILEKRRNVSKLYLIFNISSKDDIKADDKKFLTGNSLINIPPVSLWPSIGTPFTKHYFMKGFSKVIIKNSVQNRIET